MLEMMAKLSGVVKGPVIPFFLCALAGKRIENADIKRKRNHFADDEAPGDNFPFINAKGCRTRPDWRS